MASINTNQEEENQNESYRVRFIELAKAIAGLFLGSILYLLIFKTTLTGPSLILVGTTIANFIGLVLGEQVIHRLCVYFNVYKATQSKNPLYRNFKTLTSFGTAIGTTLALVFSSWIDLKLNNTIYGASAGFLLGLSAFAFRYYRQSLPEDSKKKKPINAQIGTEGWSKYTKLALSLGTSIGQSIGGYVSYFSHYDAMTSWTTMTLYGAASAIVSFVSVCILVPVINYWSRNKSGKASLVHENKELFNSNYLRTGMTLGLAIGTLLGLLGPFVLVGLSAPLSMAIGAALFSIVGGVVLSLYGHQLSSYVQKHWRVPENTDNSWSYATRNTAIVFGFIGTIIACCICPGAALLQAATIGSAISSVIGWFVGLGVIWKARQIEPKEAQSQTPWTQRISTGAIKGSIIGAACGLVLALTVCAGCSLGLIGLITLLSAIGAILAAFKEWTDDPIAQRMVTKWVHGEDKAEQTTPNNNARLASTLIPKKSTTENCSSESQGYLSKGMHFFSSNSSKILKSSNPPNLNDTKLNIFSLNPARSVRADATPASRKLNSVGRAPRPTFPFGGR